MFSSALWKPSIPLITISFDENTKSFDKICAQSRLLLNVGKVQIRPENNLVGDVSDDCLRSSKNLFLMASQCALVEKLAACAVANWLALIVGPQHSGKRSSIELLSRLTGQRLYHMQVNAETDALDLLGSFKQVG